MVIRRSRWLSPAIRAAGTPNRRAIADTVSPGRTRYRPAVPARPVVPARGAVAPAERLDAGAVPAGQVPQGVAALDPDDRWGARGGNQRQREGGDDGRAEPAQPPGRGAAAGLRGGAFVGWAARRGAPRVRAVHDVVPVVAAPPMAVPMCDAIVTSSDRWDKRDCSGQCDQAARRYPGGRTREPGGTGLRGGLAAPDRRT